MATISALNFNLQPKQLLLLDGFETFFERHSALGVAWVATFFFFSPSENLFNGYFRFRLFFFREALAAFRDFFFLVLAFLGLEGFGIPGKGIGIPGRSPGNPPSSGKDSAMPAL